MKITELITRLTKILGEHGDLEITRYYDGVEYVPRLEVSDRDSVQNSETFEYEDIQVPKRVMIK